MMDEQDHLLMCSGTTKYRQKRIKENVNREIKRQRDSWNAFIKNCVYTIFYLNDINTTFFTKRNELRKRSNITLDERIYLKAPSNIELRMPVAINKTKNEKEVILYDIYGKQNLRIETAPDFEINENRIYIMKQIRHYPMFPYEPVLGECKNKIELYLKPTTLSLNELPDAEDDYEILRDLQKSIEAFEEDEAIEIITMLQNYYRLNGYYVERENKTMILVEGKETFLIAYSTVFKTLKICILIDDAA